jgi:peptide chain release factor 2
VHGRNAYGMLTSEIGVHRLVRISPTDEKKRRQTTFAGVEVLPLLPDEIVVEIREEDLRIDVYRSSGPGGQSVNTTDSAVRITHLPTNLVVTCQNEKSQLKNKDSAMKILRSRLYDLKKAERDAELSEMRVRSATTCSTRTRWSRTSARASRPAT